MRFVAWFEEDPNWIDGDLPGDRWRARWAEGEITEHTPGPWYATGGAQRAKRIYERPHEL